MISIAIPDSLFVADDTLRDKTIKVGEIARASAIFGVERIYIYRDSSRNYDSNYDTARTIFEYMDTPQYLRKRLFGRRKELEYAGLLPPLRTPNHSVIASAKLGDVRDGVIISWNGELVVDLGFKELARLEGRGQEGQRLTFSVISVSPLVVKNTQKPSDLFWGYEVRRAPSLVRFLKSVNFDLIVLTSRLGRSVAEIWNDFYKSCDGAAKILICFGSPEFGVDKFLKQDGAKVLDFDCMYLNLFPGQNTETIRLEEAILGTLALVNLAKQLKF
ncbi:MAG: methylase [Nitrososphaerota archaeon]|nr:methylase [Nitrososphaerota archaeon]